MPLSNISSFTIYYRLKSKINAPKYRIISKNYKISSSKSKLKSLKLQLDSNTESIRDDIIETQVLKLISDILVENLEEEKRRSQIIIPQKREIIIQERRENFPTNMKMENMWKFDFESDSFDEMDSGNDLPSIRYDYSPK